MRSFAVLVALVSALTSGAARAQGVDCTFFGLTGPVACVLVTVSTVGTTAGSVAITFALAKSMAKGSVADGQAAAAEHYLRQNSLQLAQDLATGEGPVLDEISAALHISRQNEGEFRRRMTRHRAELLALAEPSRLDRTRAVAFLDRILELLEPHEGLRADIARLAARSHVN